MFHDLFAQPLHELEGYVLSVALLRVVRAPARTIDMTSAAVLAWRWSFIPLLYLQAALMHPHFCNNSVARLIRVLVAPPIIYTALTVYQHTLFQPVELNIPLNLSVVGSACAAFAMLSVQLAIVSGPFYRFSNASANGKKVDGPPDGFSSTANGRAETAPAPSWLEIFSYTNDLIHR